MKLFKTGALLGAVAVVGLGAGYAVAQNDAGETSISPAEFSTYELKIQNAYGDAQIHAKTIDEAAKEGVDAERTLASGYAKAASSNTTTREFLSTTLGGFYSRTFDAKTAPQVTQLVGENQIRLNAFQVAQNAKIIEQNARIIQLLEAQAKKK